MHLNVFSPGIKSNGSVWISDMIRHSVEAIQSLMWQRYGEYLTDLKDEAYRNHVFNYIDKEDTLRLLMYQLDLMRTVGFRKVEILHKNSSFSAFGRIKQER